MPVWVHWGCGRWGGVDNSHRVGGLLCLGPGLKGGEIRHIVIFSSLIQLSALLHKGWAGPVPACMAVAIAQDPVGVVQPDAVCCAVLLSTHTTGVELLGAGGGHVVPPMAFEASQQLSFTFLGIHLLLTHKQTVSQRVICGLWG